jgi:hypothetical protein
MRAPKLLVSVLVSSALLAAAAVAVGQQPAPGLRAEIERDYAVSAAPGGLVLKPRESRVGVESIAVAGSTVRINGAKVPAGVVRSWLGDQAADVLALAELAPAEQRRLFGLDEGDLGGENAEAGPPAGAAPPAEAPAEEAPEAGVEAPPAPEPPPHPGLPPLPPVPSPPRPPSPPSYRAGSQFTLFNDLTVRAEESAREAVAVFGSVTVEGEVRGEVTAVFGSVWVDGRVEQEVTAVFGSVYLGPRAEVLRGVTAVGGRVERQEGAVVRGPVTEVPMAGVPRLGGHGWPGARGTWRGPFWAFPWGGFGGIWSLYWRLFVLAALTLLLSATLLVAPRPVEGVARRCRDEWWQSGLTGLLTVVAYVPAVLLVCALLTITIIGCILVPFVVLLAVIVPLVVFFVAYSGAAVWIGRWLTERLGWGWTSPYAHLLVGVAVVEALRFAGSLTVAADRWSVGLGWLLLGLGDLLRFVVVTIGLGAAVLNRFGRDRSAAVPPGAEPEFLPPAPPPPPEDAPSPSPGTLPPVTEPEGDAGP